MIQAKATAGRDWPWPWIICGYLAFHVVFRRLLGGGLGIDEAQILLWGEQLSWGYGPQPPLYSWLQWAAFRLISDSLLAMTALKNALLAVVYLAVYALFRTAHAPRVAGLAAAGLILIPPLSWDSQRAMTHSVLVLALTTVLCLVFWSRVLPGRRGGWLIFGLLTGLGILAKLNFVVVPLALLVSALSMDSLRAQLRPSGFVAAAAIAAALVAMPLRWILQNQEAALASMFKLKLVEQATSHWHPAWQGMFSFLVAVGSCLGLAAAVILLIRRFRGATPPAAPEPTLLDRLLLRYVLVGSALALLGVLATGTTFVRDIWLLPILFPVAPLAVVWLLGRVTPAGARTLRNVFVGLALLVIVALGVHIPYGDPGHPSLRAAPITDIAEQLERRYPSIDRIVADPEWLAGNLTYFRPDLPVVSSFDPGPAPAPEENVVLIWWDRGPEQAELLSSQLSAKWDTSIGTGEIEPLEAPFPPQPLVMFGVLAAPLTVNSPR